MKRTLALVLALVMVLGMMAIPASADFTDSKDVKYTEAVDVVAACGIINGFEDGSFDPHGNLTREQAAKIVAYMRLGQKNADALKATSAPFEDVAANRWSAGFISYCVNEGIINGRSDKIFDPTGNVTAFEFAKLMLGALGYDSAIEEYTGASWAINVGKTALDIDLFDGNDGANYNEPATREEAALYVLNTLQADLVEYDQKGTNIDLGNGITINTGASKAEVVTTKNSNGGNMGDKADNNGYYTYQFAEKYFEDLEKTTTSDDFSRPATQWTYDKTDVGTYSDEPEVTYTAKVKGEDIYKALGKPKNAGFTYYVNGASVAVADLHATDKAWGAFKLADDEFNANDSDSMASETKKIGGNGVLVEVFEDPDNDDDYIVSIIPSYVGEISAWKAAKGANDEYVTVSVAEGTNVKAPDSMKGKYETDIFSEDDASDNTVVIYTYSSKEEKIESVFAADVATGIVTATKGSDGFTLDGTSYKYAASYTGEVTYDKDSEDKLDVYTDAYGYVIHSDKTEGDTKDSMLIVAVNDETNWNSITYSAKVVFPGSTTVEIVTLKVESKASDDKFDADDFAALENSLPAVATYTKFSGKYVLDTDSIVAVADTKTETNAKVITSGKAMMAIGTNQKDIAANSETIFLFVKPDSTSKDVDDYKYTTYTGIKNVPDVKAKDDTKIAYIADKDDAYAEFVVVFDGKSSQTASDELYFVHASTISKELNDDSHDDPYYTVKMYNVATGDVETIELAQKAGKAIEDAKTTDLFVTGYSTDDGLVDSWDLAENDDYTVIKSDETKDVKSTLEAKKGNLVIVGAAKDKADKDMSGTYGIDSDATAYLYSNDDKTVDATSITSLRKTSADDYTFTVVLNDDDQVVTAFVLDD